MVRKNSKKPGKRPVYVASRFEKVVALRRIVKGESKAQVGQTSGIPEATLRGWLKKPELVAEAGGVHIDAVPQLLASLIRARTGRNKKSKANRKNGASTSGTTKSSGKSSSGNKSANRRKKTRTGSQSGNDSGVADLSDASNSNKSSINKTKRSTKRKRTHTGSTDDDCVPAKRRIVDEDEKVTHSNDSSDSSQQVNDLESRNGKDLLYELFAKDLITRDIFIYMWETMKSLEI